MQYKELPTWARNRSGYASSSRMVDMKDEPEEENEPVRSSGGSYPYGLCLRLTEKDLDKLGLDDDVEAGDYLHCVIMAKVTSVSRHHHDSGDGVNSGCNIEMQIVAMSVEDESTEYEDEED